MLNKVEQRKAVYFMFNNGAILAYSIQMYCQSCKTTYHLNYKVVGNERICYDYASGLPDVLQVSDHYFVDHKLADLWKMMMHTTSCVSATSCARIYSLLGALTSC
ncbi:hypothetical protein BDN67DRAFT_538288 [Paxillus ammoniavirescens]|nr:hypothetical protein BDN67DRAFT_538288 [Paxillus ammoniavirescens]